MRIPRIYQNSQLRTGQVLDLDQAATQHLLKVLRLRLNDKLQIFDGVGNEVIAQISAITAKQCQVTIIDSLLNETESSLQIHLAMGMIRNDKMDLIIQKAVELGVQHITPLITQYCNIKMEASSQKLQHWQRIAINACEQCGRSYLPELHAPSKLVEWLKTIGGSEKTPVKTIAGAEARLILHPYAEQSLADINFSGKAVYSLIGPEGGFSEPELELAHAHGFTSIKFGPRILRAETAALSAITAIQNRWGDM